MTRELLVFGVGNMGGAIVQSILEEDALPDCSITLVDPESSRAAPFIEDKRVRHVPTTEALESSYQANYALIAIKPQLSAELTPSIIPFLSATSCVISIMAGRSLAAVGSDLQHTCPIIRAMPNLPLQIQNGITLLFPSPEVPTEAQETAEELFGAGGTVMFVSEERLVDAATAVSGSGPAFVFHLLEGAHQAAVSLGFSPEEAKELVSQTVLGAVYLYGTSDLPLTTLAEQVTSKGGTTEAGLTAIKERAAQEAITAGIKCAFTRAQELADDTVKDKR